MVDCRALQILPNGATRVRRKLVAGNWKMNLDKSSSLELVKAITFAEIASDVDVAVCVPYVYLDTIGQALDGSSVSWGAQDVYFEASGAFTGEISCSMLKDLGCRFVILGHSERRNVIGEDSELINRKVKAALAGGLVPILCVGELLEQRESGQTLDVVKDQFERSLDGIDVDQMKNVVLAYEPVWAIGTGKTATPEQAQEVHADLRKIMLERYNSEVSDRARILYGGSVKPENAAELMSQPDIDGALVGGASLKSESFLQIIAASQTNPAV